MPETCVLGHAWTPGRVLCAECGFGPRAIQPGRTEAAAGQAAEQPATQAVTNAASPELAVAGRVGALPDAPHPPEPELVLSPDGHWAWDGTQWIPAPPQDAPEPEPTPQADLMPEPRRARRRHKATAADRTTGGRRTAPRALIGVVLVLAIAAAADYALKEPPLGHKAAATSAAPVTSTASILAHQNALAQGILRGGALAEKSYRAKSGLYTNSAAVLQKAGMPAVAAPAVFEAQAHHGTGFCLVSGAVSRGHRFYLYDSAKGGLRPTVYATAAAALKGCSQH